jgi:hypothetical protein
VIASHKGQPEVVKKKDAKAATPALKVKVAGARGERAAARLRDVQRGGQVVIHMLANVKRKRSSRSSKGRARIHVFIRRIQHLYTFMTWGYVHKHGTMDVVSSREMKMAMAL